VAQQWDGTFTDVTSETGTGVPGFSTGAAFVDYDRMAGSICLLPTTSISGLPI